MYPNRSVRVLGLIVLVLLAGCSGGSSGPAAGDGGAATTGAPTTAAGGGVDGASADWCVRGQTNAWANPQSGEQVSMEVQGVVSYEGREVCKAVWTTNQGDVQRIELYYSEDESYRKMVSYDAEGEVVNEFEMTGGTSDGASADGSDGAAADWCSSDESMTFANPETGEMTSMEVEGIVERDGREVCKAVWTTNQGDVQRIEMFFNEDESYQVMVMYDANGEVVNEVRMSGSSDG